MKFARWLRPLRRADLPAMGLMVVAVMATWFLTYRLWPWELSTPFEYSQDAMFQLGAARAAADRGLSALWGGVDLRLGAPAGARWADFPFSEDAMYLGVGVLSRIFGAVAGLNLAYLGTCVLAALTMFYVGRTLRISAAASALAGALFAMAPYVYWRNLHHFNLTVYWPLSLSFLLWLWAGGRLGLRMGTRRFKLALGFSALLAVHSIYYFNYAMQVLLVIGVLQAFRRKWPVVKAIVAVMAFGALMFVLVNADTFYLVATKGPNLEAVHRSIDDVVRFGLRPMELWIPSPLHRLDVFAKWGTQYRPFGTGEFPSMFLGVVGGVGFPLVLIHAVMSLFGMRKPGLAARFGFASLWLVVLAVPGGLLQAFQQVTGFIVFRSNNRVSLLILGMALLYVARLLSAKWSRAPLQLAVVAAVLGVFGLWEQSVNLDKLGGEPYASVRVNIARQNLSDIEFGKVLDREVPEGAALIQFPPMAFPEGGGAPGMADYEHFRLYIHTEHVRFSYGAMKGRPEAAFNFKLWSTPPIDAVPILEANGFKGAVFRLGAISLQQVQGWAAQAATVKPNHVVTSPLGDWAAVIWN